MRNSSKLLQLANRKIPPATLPLPPSSSATPTLNITKSPSPKPTTTKKAITLSAFRSALLSTWRPSRRTQIGLAISGGVDSMALAYLCSLLQASSPNFIFKAFIVDHRARLDSAREAATVAKSLEKLGLPAEVIKLSWPTSPSSQKRRFETSARRLRYQALGRACFRNGIRSLLLAHHADDQAETVLGRILSGRTGLGLQCMKPSGNIPECHGIYGVSAKCDQPRPAQRKDVPKHVEVDDLPQYVVRHQNGRPTKDFARGGIQVHRPLLRFTKEQLIATCMQSGTAWVEDVTNTDVRLTTRNSVRYLLESECLPYALRQPTLMKLQSFWRNVADHRSMVADVAFHELAVSKFEPRSGALVFSVPICATHNLKRDGVTSLESPGSILGHGSDDRDAAKLVERIAMVVSPCKSVEKDQLANVVAHMFPVVEESASETDPAVSSYQAMTAAGVHWAASFKDAGTPQARRVWQLTRQAPASNRRQPKCVWMNHRASEQTADEDCVKEPFWTWQLFDGRFWIRARDKSCDALSARLLQKDDLRYIRQHHDRPTPKLLELLLSEVAPGAIRFTLPVLTAGTSGAILALPTLDYRLDTSSRLRWEIAYKKVVLPGMKADLAIE